MAQWPLDPASGAISVGYKDQSDYVTEESGSLSGFEWLVLDEVVIPSWEREAIETNRPTGQPGASSPPKWGARSGSFSVSFYLQGPGGQGWDPTSEAIPVPAGWDLLEEVWGSGDSVAYAAADVGSGPDALVVPITTAVAIGNAIAFGTPEAVAAIGWTKSVSTGDYTMISTMRAAPQAGDAVLPVRTIYSSTAQPTPKTFRIVGKDADHDIILVGCFPSGTWTITFEKGKHIKVSGQYTYTDRIWGSAGAVQVPTDYADLNVLTGEFGARAVLGFSTATSADAEGTCNLQSLQLSVELMTRQNHCHGARQGVSDVIVLGRKYMVGFTIPFDEDTLLTGDSPDRTIFEASQEDGTTLQMLGEVGKASGRLFAWCLPSLHVTNVSHLEDSEGLYAISAELAAGVYSGDTGSDSVTNTVARLMFG